MNEYTVFNHPDCPGVELRWQSGGGFALCKVGDEPGCPAWRHKKSDRGNEGAGLTAVGAAQFATGFFKGYSEGYKAHKALPQAI